MRRKARAARALLAVLIALVICYFCLSPKPAPGDAPSQAPEGYAITAVAVADAAAISIQNERAAFAVMQEGGSFEVVSDVQGNYDDAQLRALMYAACNLTGTDKESDPTAFAGYGMDLPRARVQLILRDGSRRSFLLLARDPLKARDYLYDEQTNAVYALGAAVGDLFTRAPIDFFSHTIFPLRDQQSFANVTRLSLSTGDGKGFTVEWTGGGCRLTSPVTCRISPAVVSESLLAPVAKLYADAVVAAGVDLAEYGFDGQSPCLTLTCAGRTYRAVFSADGEGRRLMADPASGTVLRFDDDPLPALARDYTALLDGRALYCPAGDISGIALTVDGQTVSVVLSGAGETLTARKDGQTMDAKALSGALNGLTLAGEIEQMPDNAPVMAQMRLSWRNGGEETVTFLDAGQSLCALTVSGETNFVTTMQAARTLIDLLA